MPRLLLAAMLCAVALAPSFAQERKTREQKVREDKQRIEAEGFWLYNDLPGAIAQAKQTGKPILVVLRCLPCEECVKLDDELVEQDPVIRPLLDEFVCVRVVGTNGLDLNTFQYDTDQSFAVFMLNADGTIYGRFGTRSHRTEWVGDVSLAGMGKALQAALDLHRDYPANRGALAGKRGPEPEVPTPEQYPALKDKYTSELNYEGNVVQSCIHCHQIGDAQRQFYWQQGKPIPEKVLFPYPHPKSIGLILDPREKATVREVTPGSPADRSGFEAGDAIETLDGQPLISMADVQWVLHNAAPAGAEIPARVIREGKAVELTLKLTKGWRRAGDISWRVTSWGLGRMLAGGMRFEEIPAEERPSGAENVHLRIRHVGQYGPHATAKKAGFQVGDLLVSYDGHAGFQRESDLFAYGARHVKAGETVEIAILRNGAKKTLQLPIQE